MNKRDFFQTQSLDVIIWRGLTRLSATTGITLATTHSANTANTPIRAVIGRKRIIVTLFASKLPV